jgi:hypothetical protein
MTWRCRMPFGMWGVAEGHGRYGKSSEPNSPFPKLDDPLLLGHRNVQGSFDLAGRNGIGLCGTRPPEATT